MTSALNRLLMLVALVLFNVGQARSAVITVVKNPYVPYDRFLQKFSQSHKIDLQPSLKSKIEQKLGDFSLFEFLLTEDFAYDAHQGCDQLGYVLIWERAIKIEGELKSGDEKIFEKMFNSPQRDDPLKCGIPVLIDSPGGDLAVALEIARLIRTQSGFVIVPEGGQCLSACIFILMAAHYESATVNVSKAFAFSNAVIGIHWPELSSERLLSLRRLAYFEPNLLFQYFGQYWTKINSYTIRATHSTWLSTALVNSLALPPNQMYVVDSGIERKIAGINSIVLPDPADRMNTENSALRNVCWRYMLSANSRRVVESKNYELRMGNVYVLYYPSGDMVCLVDIASKSIRVDAGPYLVNLPLAGGLTLDWVKRVLWEELGKVGLSEHVIGKEIGIGKAINELHVEDLATRWGVFTRLTEDTYGCVQCGYNAGVFVFSPDESKCHRLGKSSKAASYLAAIRKAGFYCENLLDVYIYARLRFRILDEGYAPTDTLTSIPAFLQEGTIKVSDDCLNEVGVCSTAIGTIVGGVLNVSRRGNEEPRIEP
jgi:hypothetical protein